MGLLSDDYLTQLAFALHDNKGVFALLVGSGISRAADIPTGWEITIDLIRRVGIARKEPEQTDWADWYRKETGQEPDYSALLEELAASPEERRAIIHRYIEPTEEEREQEKKVPTAAHYAIADLVRGGFIRVIVTTNFDRLIENALRERGIEPTIVSSPDALAGAEPITHTTCYLLKLHGDYKDARILNTDAELGGYPEAFDRLLDRILDEHGLIVCGWSGEWDHALRAAILRTPNRRYSTFWSSRGALGQGAQELASHRRARVVPIADADAFFTSLRDRAETLERTQRKNPLSIELLVNSAKRFLARPEHRIQLDELLTMEAERLLNRLKGPDFDVLSSWDPTIFGDRVRRLEAASEGLASMVGVLGRWGNGAELPLVLDTLRVFYAYGEKIESGVDAYRNLRGYPAVLAFTAYGLGLTRSNRWDVLYRFLRAELHRDRDYPRTVVEALFLDAWSGGQRELWRVADGGSRAYTPLSERMLATFSAWGSSFVGLVPEFSMLFEKFELLASLAYLSQNEKADVRESLERGAQGGWVSMPVGRSAWHVDHARLLVAEMKSDPLKTELLKAGFARGDAEFLELYEKVLAVQSRRIRW